MQDTTDTVIGYALTTEPLSEEEAAKQQQNIMELRKVQPRVLPRSQEAVGMRAL